MIYQNGKKIGSIKVIESAYMGASKKFKASKGLSLQPLKSVTITQNGTTNVLPDEGFDGMQSVDVVVDVPVPKEPYTEETYDDDGNLIAATLYGYSYVPNRKFTNKSYLSTVIFPDGIESIKGSAFYGCKIFDIDQIPSSVKKIEEDAFYDCGNLKLKSLPEGLSEIADYAFRYCRSLRLEYLPSDVQSIGTCAFEQCWNMPLSTLPSGLTNISSYAFVHCSKIKITSLPEGITRIEDNAFYSCFYMPLASLPNNISYIGKEAFYYCNRLAIKKLPENLKYIGSSAFGHGRLSMLYSIPSGATTIEADAFLACGMSSIKFEGTPENIANTVFKACNKLTEIRVPWSEGEVANAPWGATNATIIYNYTEPETETEE